MYFRSDLCSTPFCFVSIPNELGVFQAVSVVGLPWAAEQTAVCRRPGPDSFANVHECLGRVGCTHAGAEPGHMEPPVPAGSL